MFNVLLDMLRVMLQDQKVLHEVKEYYKPTRDPLTRISAVMLGHHYWADVYQDILYDSIIDALKDIKTQDEFNSNTPPVIDDSRVIEMMMDRNSLLMQMLRLMVNICLFRDKREKEITHEITNNLDDMIKYCFDQQCFAKLLKQYNVRA